MRQFINPNGITYKKKRKIFKEGDYRRKRDIIFNVVLYPEERSRIESRLFLLGIPKAEYYINSLITDSVDLCYSILNANRFYTILNEICEATDTAESICDVPIEQLESMRTILDMYLAAEESTK